MADSAAATVKINKAKICPMISSKKKEKIIKLKFMAKSINSIDISIRIIFFLFNIIPDNPIRKSTIEINKNLLISVNIKKVKIRFLENK